MLLNYYYYCFLLMLLLFIYLFEKIGVAAARRLVAANIRIRTPGVKVA